MPTIAINNSFNLYVTPCGCSLVVYVFGRDCQSKIHYCPTCSNALGNTLATLLRLLLRLLIRQKPYLLLAVEKA